MKFPLYVGLRYLVSKKSNNIINIISLIAIIGIAISTMALVIVLSVLNGFNELVASLYNSFEPDIMVTAAKGKTFQQNAIDFEKLNQIPSIMSVSMVVEDNVLLKKNDKQCIATIKGVSSEYFTDGHFDTLIYLGNTTRQLTMGYVGFGIAANLDLITEGLPNNISVITPKRNTVNLTNPATALKNKNLTIGGIFTVQQEIDDKYIIAPIEFAKQLFEYDNEITSLEIRLKNKKQLLDVQKSVQSIVGPDFVVKNNMQLHETMFKVMRSEKIFTFMMLSFILLIATMNLIGSLSMIIIEKERDNTILWSMGATITNIKAVYYTENFFMLLMGGLGGLLLGWIVCLIQIHFGLIKFSPEASLIIDHYPVKIVYSDLIMIFLTIMAVGSLTSLIPVKRLKISKNFNRK